MTDSLTLRDIECWTRIGLSPRERQTSQRLLVTVSFPVNAAAVAQKDDPSTGIDYDDVMKSIRETSKDERKTIERFAEDLAAALLGDLHLESVTVTIEKHPYPDAQAVLLTITRPLSS